MKNSMLPAVLLLGIVSNTNSELADTGSELDAGRLAGIPKQMEKFVEQKEIAGSVTLVARHGHVAGLEAVGFQDMEKGVRMKKDTIFRIASMTKPITAAGVMILQEAGKLSVDDPVEKHLPEFRDMWLVNEQTNNNMTLKKPSRPIIIRDILTHTSGLSEARRDIPLKSISDVALIAAHLPLQFEPGSQWRYGGSGMITAGRLIEVVSGQPYDQFLHDHIFLPLGMKDTFFFPSKDVEDRIAVTYERAENGELIPIKKSQKKWNFPLPSGGLYSTAADMGVWMQTILSGGVYQGVRILSEQSVKEMTSLQTGELKTGFTEGMGFGLGWGLVRNPAGVTKMLAPGTFGHGGAYGTQNWADPEKDMIFILMIQRQGFGNGDASNVRQKFQEIAVSAITN